ncbi:hypothetical protein FNV43_RR27301 [Rhamnella rubrinervis]|uniref:Uncharacterized protein n=1 Tax=Rhamnella rubrinervis TaxID=2594499 RepID=A0A8K0DLD4_9ROSA|nr:hypothetical protein FNV43_RR27301 [Rhamnella rubrinervis]
MRGLFGSRKGTTTYLRLNASTNREKVEKNDATVVVGTIFLYGMDAFVLFVSSWFAFILTREPVCLVCYLYVVTPSGVSMSASFMLESYEVCFGSEKLCVDLIILEMFDFDVIFEERHPSAKWPRVPKMVEGFGCLALGNGRGVSSLFIKEALNQIVNSAPESADFRTQTLRSSTTNEQVGLFGGMIQPPTTKRHLVSSLLRVLRKKSSAWVEKPFAKPTSKILTTGTDIASSSRDMCLNISIVEGLVIFMSRHIGLSSSRLIVVTRCTIGTWTSFRDDSSEQQAMANHLPAQGIMVPPTAATSFDDEDPEKSEDPEEHLDLEDEDLWNYPESY